MIEFCKYCKDCDGYRLDSAEFCTVCNGILVQHSRYRKFFHDLADGIKSILLLR